MKKLIMFCITFVFCVFISCDKDIENQEVSANSDDSMTARTFTADSTMLQNPYSVKVMQAALDNIKNQGKINTIEFDNFQITATHKYIKFNPRNRNDEDLLKDDTDLFLFDYRLDCEYSEKYFLNKKPDNDSIPNYYTAIEINKVLPNVPYEVLEELYIPEQDKYFDNVVDIDRYEVNYEINNKTDLFFTLISNAFEQTKNYEDVGIIDSNTQARWIFGRRWRPAGRIRVEDTTKNTIYPVEGAKVHIRQWFTMSTGITNANGDFSTGPVRGRAKYVLQWERYHYSIRSGWFGQAETKSPRMLAQNWNCDIIRSLDHYGWYYATIHQAAHDYYYKDILNLHRPQLNTFWNSQMKIAARNITSTSVHANQTAIFGILPSIYLCAWDRPSERVYGTTIHELAHSAHREMGTSAYASLVWKGYIEPEAWVNDTDKYKSARRVLESWATAVEITLTNLRYQRLDPTHTQYRIIPDPNRSIGNLQNVPLTFGDVSTTYYTPAYFDLTDNVDQNRLFTGVPVDKTANFTIKQIEDAVKNSSSWGEVKQKIVAQNPGFMGAQANTFLSQWQ